MRFVRFVMRFVLSLAVFSCAANDAQLEAKVAPELHSSAHATVSILGVMKGGRMSADVWPDFAPSFFGGACPIAFDDKLDPAIASAVDQHVRANGMTESLFGAFGAATDADLVLLLEVSGQLPKVKSSSPVTFRGGTKRGALPNPTADDDEDENHDALEMSAAIYSVRLGRSVGSVSMRYTGKSASEALDRFSKKLSATLEGTRCTAWKGTWPAPEAIKALK